MSRTTPLIWHLSVVPMNGYTRITGVVLRKLPFFKPTNMLRNLVSVVHSYFLPALAKKRIKIVTGDMEHSTLTDQFGGFSFEIGEELDQVPEIYYKTNTPLTIAQQYPVIFPSNDAGYEIISDIDDTIIRSYTSQFFRMIRATLLTAPHRRKGIKLTEDLFREIARVGARTFYVSRSESNLFRILTTFILNRDLPKGALLLTPYLNLRQFLRKEKGMNFKLTMIRSLVKELPQRKFILFGDDSQQDIVIYTRICEEFNNQILRVYIHQTRAISRKRKEEEWKALMATGVKGYYFHDPEEIDLQAEVSFIKELAHS